MSELDPPAGATSVIPATDEMAAAARSFEITVVRMLMAADSPAEVHPMMKGAMRAAGTMALQFINTDADAASLAWLVDDMEKDCQDIVKVLREALAARNGDDDG